MHITQAHWHLLYNHMPVIGSMFAFVLLLYGMLRKSAEVKRVALVTFIFVALMSWFSDTTGGKAAQAIRGAAGVANDAIRAHAQAADSAVLIAYACGLIAVIGLVMARKHTTVVPVSTDNAAILQAARQHKTPPSWAIYGLLVLGAVEVWTMSNTAYLGGAIRHPEIVVDSLPGTHPSSRAPQPPPAAPVQQP